ncbi:MAG: hypothetical protein V1934_04955 [Methanobacteriota archaeon]
MARRRTKKKSQEAPQATIDNAKQPEAPPVPEQSPAATEESTGKLGSAVSKVVSETKLELEEEKFQSKLLQWEGEGYAVDKLQEMLSLKDPDTAKAFEKYESDMEELAKLKSKLLDMNISGLDAEAEEINRDVNLKNPFLLEEIQSKFAALKKKSKVRDMVYDLDGLILPSTKARVESLKQKLAENPDLVDSSEMELADIRREYKEAYFLEGVQAETKTREPIVTKKVEVAKPDKPLVPMVVSDIFLLYKDGKFISHHTTRVASRDEQTEIFADLRTSRNYVRSPKYVAGRLNVVTLNGKKILVQSGKNVIVVLVMSGDLNPWTERIVGKVVNLLEKEDGPALANWTGDVAALRSAGKYMTALLYACMKLAKGGQPS